MGRKLTYCFDIDGTICSVTDNQQYQKAEPYQDRIDRINNLYDQGHTIKFHTARGQTSGKSFQELTLLQLEKWGAKYHSVIFGKPSADVYVDDKGISPTHFFV